MICKNCGADCAPGTLYCTSCGSPLPEEPQQEPTQQTTQQPYGYQQPYSQQPYGYQPPQKPAEPAQGLAIASMILGILSFMFMPLITGIVAICLGCSAKSKGNRSGMATAGIVCGSIALAFIVLIIILVIVFIASGGLEPLYDLIEEYSYVYR